MKDGDIPTIFNPRRARAPSVVVTGEEILRGGGTGTDGGGTGGGGGGAAVPNGPFANTAPPPRHFQHSDSVAGSQIEGEPIPNGGRAITKLKGCKNTCCSQSATKIYFGICVTVCVTASWVGATHCIKYLYLGLPLSIFGFSNDTVASPYNAPFFTTWFCTNWTILFFPLYFLCRLVSTKCSSPCSIISESIQPFRERGFTTGRFLTRCGLFCLLWVATNYLYIHSLRILHATDVMALFATNVSSVYLLSWVILHEQFVGVRIVAVILCDTGIALLAYMEGITGSLVLGGVVMAAVAAAGSAVYKVLFKKVIGDASFGQVSLFFSLIGLLNLLLLWPLCLALYFTGVEILHWDRLPWPALMLAGGLSLIANLLGNFSVALTYDLFITLGLITAVPVSAALDVVLYGAEFLDMETAGMILIAVGFFLVMFPDNWPDYITRLLRNIIMLSHSARWSRRHRHGTQGSQRRDIVDYRTGYIRSHLRSPSGRVR